MAIRSTPTFLQAGSHSAENTRLMLGGMVGAATGSFSGGVAASDPAHGVIRSTDLAVTQNGTPNMTVNIAAGGAFLRGTESSNQGAYHIWNDATLNLGLASADSTNPRRDLVVAYVRDSAYSGSSDVAQIVIVTGTPAASPTDPSLTAYPNALVLARIAVAANDTAITTAEITDLRTQANILNQVAPFTSTTARSQFIPTPYDGQGAYLNDGTAAEGVYWYNGTNWRLPWNMPWGVVGVATKSANQTGIGSSATDVTSLSVGWTAVANRYYRTTVIIPVFSQITSNGIVNLHITDNTSPTPVIKQSVNFQATAGTDVNIQSFVVESNIAAGSATRKARILTTGGSGTITSSSTNVPTIVVEDLGPSGAPA